MRKFTFAFAVTVLLTVAVFADIRLPDTPKPAETTTKSVDSGMTIRLSDEAKETKLIIPKSMLKEVRAALDEADDASGVNASLTNSTGNFTRAQTVVSGFFMSLAIIFGGVWFARSRGNTAAKTSKKIIAGAVLFFIGSMATFVYANVGPPSTLRKIDGRLFDKKVFGSWRFASGAIKVEVSNTARNFELIVPDKEDTKTNEE